MTDGNKELVGFAAAGGLLAGLYAWQRSGGPGGGMGQTGPTVELTIDGTSAVQTVPPSSYFFIKVCGLAKTDWVETNANPTIYGPMGNPLFAGSQAGYNNTLPPSWLPYFTSDPRSWPGVVWGTTGPLNNAASWATMISANGCWESGQTAPQKPGNYTLLIAINGRMAFTMTLVVTGSPGLYTGGGIKVGTAVPGAGAPTLQQAAAPASASTLTAQAPYPTAAGSTAAQTAGSGTAASSAAAGATVAMVPAAAAGAGITGFLESSIMGIPAWILLAAAAGAVWYFTSGKES